MGRARRTIKAATLPALLAFVLAIAGCAAADNSKPEYESESSSVTETTLVDDSVQDTVDVDEIPATQNSPAQGSDVISDNRYLPTEWEPATYPNYIRFDGPAVVTENLAPGEIVYKPLDELGRCQGVTACVTMQMRDEGTAAEREDISFITPSGWTENEETDIPLPDGTTYHGLFYNRSHLLAKSLGGADIPENLITGTRTQNVGAHDGSGGMAYVETVAREWLDDNPDGWVYYAATPVYEGDDLVCRSVYVDVRSSDGSVDMHVEVFNAAAGHEIDYATGAWARTETSALVEPETTSSEQSEEQSYVLNIRTHKFHLPTCESVDDMAEYNKWEFTGTRDEVLSMGYEPCHRCNP